MNLHLKRPLVFLDFETTGLDTQKDRIVELAFVRLLPDGSRESLVQRINPGIEVSKAATKVTGIHTLDACGLFWGPPLKKVGQKLVDFHSAEADTQATVDVLLAQLQRHKELPRTVPELAAWCAKNSERNREEESASAGGAGA